MNDFKLFVENRINPYFTNNGYSPKNLAYQRKNESNNSGFIWLQRTKYSTSIDPEFDLNIGIYSHYLADKLGRLEIYPNPDFGECHVQIRLGFLLRQNSDYRFKFDINNRESAFEDLTTKCTTYIFPFIEKYTLDKNLIDYLSMDSWTGLTDKMREKYLTLFLS